MKITKKQIKELKKIYNEKKKTEQILSEQIRVAQDRYSDKKVKFKREGKRIEVTEKILWTEVYNAGTDCQAGKILSEKYPEIFTLYEKDKKLASDLNKFTVENWSFFFNQMSLVMLIDLVKALIKFYFNPLNWF